MYCIFILTKNLEEMSWIGIVFLFSFIVLLTVLFLPKSWIPEIVTTSLHDFAFSLGLTASQTRTNVSISGSELSSSQTPKMSVSILQASYSSSSDTSAFVLVTGLVSNLSSSQSSITCVVGSWMDDVTQPCNVSCGTGTKGQKREITTQGKDCPALTQTVPCVQSSCPTDCVVGPWTDDLTRPCNVSCGTGTKGQKREITTQGKDCPALTQTVPCVQSPCPTDCVVGPWTDDLTRPCNVSCGTGTKGQKREITIPPLYQGKECPALTQTTTCVQSCPIDCVVGTTWIDDLSQPCSVGCGTGTKGQKREIITHPMNQGQECPSLTQIVQCVQPDCPSDCVVGPWTDDPTQPCNVSCGTGMKRQTREIYTPVAQQGRDCHPPLTQNVPCLQSPCPIDCVVGAWMDDLTRPCNVSCGTGIKGQKREIVTHPMYQGKECPVLTQTTPCVQTPCPIDCVVGMWMDDISQPCSVTCGTGTKGQKREIVTHPMYQGKACPVLTQSVSCIQTPCPTDCVVGAWTDDLTQPCSVSCGTGSKVQKREILTPVAYRSDDCNPMLIQTVPCIQKPCSVDCVVGIWVDEPCSVSCGVGTKIQNREVLVRPVYEGKECPVVTQTVSCTLPACPINCSVGPWQEYPTLTCNTGSLNCGPGTRQQFRQVTVQPENGGTPCPGLTQSVSCSKIACVPPGFTRCGDNLINIKTSFCCDNSTGVSVPWGSVPGIPYGTQTACCNGVPYDDTKQYCCGNSIYNMNGLTKYDFKCCNNNLYNIQGHHNTDCCNSSMAYNVDTERCCMNTISRTLGNPVNGSCCAVTAYDTKQYSCNRGRLLSLADNVTINAAINTTVPLFNIPEQPMYITPTSI